MLTGGLILSEIARLARPKHKSDRLDPRTRCHPGHPSRVRVRLGARAPARGQGVEGKQRALTNGERAWYGDDDRELHEVVVDAAKCGREGHRSAREVFEEMPARGGGGGGRRLMLTGGLILSEMRLEEAKRAISRLGSFLPRIRKKVVVFRTES